MTERRARIRTVHGREAAALVASALTPDNTDSMTTRVDGDAVVTTIRRETTGGLHASVDDYVVNLTVADRLLEAADGPTDPSTASETPTGETTQTTETTETTHPRNDQYSQTNTTADPDLEPNPGTAPDSGTETNPGTDTDTDTNTTHE